MANTTSSQETSYTDDIANKEYDRAISLMQYHIELLWEEFGAFLLSETVLIGFLGTALASQQCLVGKNILVFGGAILGLILCFPWWSTFFHNYGYYLLRVAQAKRHEAASGGNLFTEGEVLSSGKVVNIGSLKLQHSWSARILPPRRAVRLLIILFVFAFAALIAITGPWWR